MTLGRSKRVVVLTRVGIVAAVAIGVVYVARAGSGGETENTLTFAGTLREVDGGVPAESLTVTFVFKKEGVAVCDTDPTDEVTPDSETGAFVAQIDLTSCPSTLFDGANVTVDIKVGTATVVTGQPISPVPYAKYADKVGSPDCPVGYERLTQDAGPMLCARGDYDYVVKVGGGASAFWIDQYEASVWTGQYGSGDHRGATLDDYGGIFPDNGQWTTPLFALSKSGVQPSTYITWFQASEACAASGKRLPTNEEWQRAARGTPDDETKCYVDAGEASSPTPHATGSDEECVSAWGAHDMIGNVWEWVSEWQWSVKLDGGFGHAGTGTWPSGYNGDGVVNIDSYAAHCDPNVAVGGTCNDINDVRPNFVGGIPAAVSRGGAMEEKDTSGLFAIDSSAAPSLSFRSVGFRCVIPR